MKRILNFLIKFYKDERGDSELVETSVALVFIFAIFIGFFLYSNAARTKVVMNYSAKEGSRAYAITKDENDGIDTALTYLSMGNVKNAHINSFGDSGIKISKDLNVSVPFHIERDNINLYSEFEFFKEFDTLYYNKGDMALGYLKRPYRMTREYRNDSDKR